MTRQNALLLALLLFAQLLLMTGSVRGSDGASRLESWTMTVTSPVVAVAHWVGGGVHGLAAATRELLGAHARNTALEAEVAQLREELERHREASLENLRLRRLLLMRDDLAPRSIGATVITSAHTATERMLILDRGSTDDVEVDQAVVAWGGAVGRVVEVGSHHAKVRLLTDPNSGIAGIVQRSRAQGMVQGAGRDTLDLLYVPRLSDVTHGDRVVASGLVGIFPRGFGIGRVLSISEKPDGSRTLELVPELDYRSLEEVLVLLEPVGGELLAVAEGGETP